MGLVVSTCFDEWIVGVGVDAEIVMEEANKWKGKGD